MAKKLLKSAFVAALASMMLFACPLTTNAAETDESTLSEELPIEVVLDKDEYSENENIKVEAVMRNESPTNLKDAQFKLLLPDGYELADGSVQASSDDLTIDGSLTLSAELKKQATADTAESSTSDTAGSTSQGTASGTTGSGSVATGDGTAAAVGLAVMLLAACAAVFMLRRGKGKSAMRCVSVILAGSMAFSGIALTCADASAAETDDEEWVTHSTSGSAEAMVNGEETTVMAVFSFSAPAEDIDTEYSAMSCTGSLPLSGTYGTIKLTSQNKLADSIDTGMIGTVSDDTDGMCYDPIDVERVDDYTLEITFVGEGSGNAAHTLVMELGEECFADSSEVGLATVPVREAEPHFESEGGSYDSESGLFSVPVDLSNTVFTATNRPQDFVIDGSYNGISFTVEAVDGEKYDGMAELKIKANCDESVSVWDRLIALDNVLTQNGVRVAPTSTSATTELTIVEEDPGEDGTTSVLDYTTVIPYASAEITSVSDDRTSMDVTLSFEATDGNVYLDEGDFEFAEIDLTESLSDDSDEAVLKESCAFDDFEILSFNDDHSSVSVRLPASVPDTLGDDTEDIYDYLQNTISRYIIRYNGGITNYWGIEVPDLTSSITTTATETAAETDDGEVGASNDTDDSSNETSTENSNEKVKTAAEILDYLKDSLNAAAGLVKGIVSKDATGYINFAGSLLGMIADLTTEFGTSGTVVTMADLKNELDSISNNLENIKTSVSNVGMKVKEVDTKLPYIVAQSDLSAALNGIDCYTYIYDTYFDTLSKEDLKEELYKVTVNFTSGDLLSENLVTSKVDADGERKFTYATELIEGNGSGIMTAYEAMVNSILLKQSTDNDSITGYTKALGYMIEGDTNASNPSIIRKYFNYIDTLYNWEPETYTAKANFICRIVTNYIIGYSMSCALSRASGQTGFIEKYLAPQAKKIYDLIYGDNGYLAELDEMKKAGDLVKSGDTNAKIKCLVDGNLYNSASFNSAWMNTSDLGSKWKKVTDVDMKVYENVGTTLSSSVITEMFNRFKNYGSGYGYTTLKDELKALGLANVSVKKPSSTTENKHITTTLNNYNDTADKLAHIVSFSSNGNTDAKASRWRKRVYSGDIILLNSDECVTQHVPIVTFDTKYMSSKARWRREVLVQYLYIGEKVESDSKKK